MKGGLAILVTFLICLVVLVAYYFVGKSQMNSSIHSLDMEIENLDARMAELRRMDQEITLLTTQLPVWRKQAQLFKKSIPAAMQDNEFFGSLADELARHPDVELQSVETIVGGAWLGEIKDDEKEKLTSMGVDPQVAAGIRVLFYSIKLNGDFDEVLNVFENLKRAQRLYTIDLIAGPAAGGSGTISVNSQLQRTPMQLTGRLYYNLPEPVLDISELESMFFDALASHVHRAIVKEGERAGKQTEPDEETAGAADAAAVDQAAEPEAPQPDGPGGDGAGEPASPETPDWDSGDSPTGNAGTDDQIALATAGSTGNATKEGRSDG